MKKENVKRPRCPECGSADVRKHGIYYARHRKQQWICKHCGRGFLTELEG